MRPLVLAVLALLAAGPTATAAAIPAPPPRERIVVEPVPTPAGLTASRFPSFTADGAGLLAAATSPSFAGEQVVAFDERGGTLRCLTCAAWTGAQLGKPFPFPDGRRVLVRIGRQTPVLPADHGVVECTPSVARCDSAAVVPIAVPSAGDRGVRQDQREMRLAPDGAHVAFTQTRRARTGREIGIGVVGRLVRAGDRYEVAGARVVAAEGELKGWTPDGRSVLFARYGGAYEAANPDVVAVDLRTGRERRITTFPDWEEDVDLAPRAYAGRRWLVSGSARGAELLEAVAQIPRPADIDAGLRSLPFVTFGAESAAIAEPWLTDEHDARGGYRGQPLAPGALAAGWDSRTNFRFRPDGTAVVFWQERFREPGVGATRVVVARLPDRAPQPLPDPAATPTPAVGAWAPALAGHVPRDEDVRGTRRRRGRVSGTLTVVRSASPARGYAERIVVRYRRFADRRGVVLDGVERSDYNGRGLYGGPARYTADVRLSGRRSGVLRARDVRIGPGVRGTIRSRVGDRRLGLGPLGRR